MNSVWDILYLRRMSIDYVSPPICEVIFSGSSNPVIILSNFQRGKVTGLVLGGFSGFRLSWNAFPGAICYSIYFIGGDNVAVLLAECVQPDYELPNPGPGPGNLVVTPITPDEGEGEPSDPIPYPAPGGGGVSNITVESVCKQTSRVGFPGTFKISREPGDTIGNLVVNFTFTGTAVNGTDFGPIPLSAMIPNGLSFVEVEIEVIEAALTESKTVVLNLTESPTYFVVFPTAFLNIRLPLLRIPDYGGAEPLFTPPVTSADTDFCEWDGTWNAFIPPPPLPNAVGSYYYQDDVGGQLFFLTASIQGKAMFSTNVSGPYNFPTPGSWQVAVYTLDELNNQETVWQGLKQGGDITSPAGVYIWNGSGSDTRGTLQIELFP